MRSTAHAAGRAGAAFALCAALLGAGCGYRSVFAAPSGSFSVVKLESQVASAQLALEVEHALREELAREGALATDGRCPCVVVEVLRADRAAAAVRAGRDASGREQPLASSQMVAVVGRATAQDDGKQTLFDTGDVRAEVHYAERSLIGEALQGGDAAKAAARRVGRGLAQRLLGHPSATEEAEGP